MLIEKFYLIISGTFDREPIVFDNEPTEEQIMMFMKEKDGVSARVEKRFILNNATE